jgi:hypothetical protein
VISVFAGRFPCAIKITGRNKRIYRSERALVLFIIGKQTYNNA